MVLGSWRPVGLAGAGRLERRVRPRLDDPSGLERSEDGGRILSLPSFAHSAKPVDPARAAMCDVVIAIHGDLTIWHWGSAECDCARRASVYAGYLGRDVGRAEGGFGRMFAPQLPDVCGIRSSAETAALVDGETFWDQWRGGLHLTNLDARIVRRCVGRDAGGD